MMCFFYEPFLEGYWEYAGQSSLLKGLRCIFFNRQNGFSDVFGEFMVMEIYIIVLYCQLVSLSVILWVLLHQ